METGAWVPAFAEMTGEGGDCGFFLGITGVSRGWRVVELLGIKARLPGSSDLQFDAPEAAIYDEHNH